MADVKPTEVILLSEKIGLPANASPEAIVARVYELQAKDERFEELQRTADNLVQRATEGEKAKADLKRVEAKLFIERAIANQWIDKHQEGFYTLMYEKHPEETKKAIEDQRFRSILGAAQRLNEGGEKPKSAVATIEAMATALMASEKLSKADAQARVLAENPDLSEQYRNEIVKGVGGAN